MRFALLPTFLVLFTLTLAADQGDWVDPFDLPIGFITAPFYAGYLQILPGQSFYYNYFPSENNPTKDPLVVRISAGPGCSVLYSTYYSKGPFIFVKQTKDFRHNPFNWNKAANVLFIEGPSGVGFSTGEDIQYTDDRAALEFYLAVEKFYQKFPELKDQQMFLTGEQYAGILVPRMAQLIVELNKDENVPAWLKIRFGGFMLNNPCTTADECDSHFDYSGFSIHFLRNHYFISKQDYQEYLSHCSTDSEECLAVKHKIQAHFMNTGVDPRNLYTDCPQQQGDIPCMDLLGINAFLRDQQVKMDLHANPQVEWKMCNPNVTQKWERDPQGSLKIYEKLLRQEHDLRIWIVSGTLSSVVPTLGSKKWFQTLKSDMGVPMQRMWEPWFYNQTVNSGDIESLRGISLVTVRSAGLYLWNDQPEIGYHILETFLNKQAL